MRCFVSSLRITVWWFPLDETYMAEKQILRYAQDDKAKAGPSLRSTMTMLKQVLRCAQDDNAKAGPSLRSG